jgi:transcriptional regulator with XRE-family HTH domain
MAAVRRKPQSVGEIMESRREKLGLSLNALAKKVGVSHVALIKIRDGKNNPRLETLRKIAEALGIPASDLL